MRNESRSWAAGWLAADEAVICKKGLNQEANQDFFWVPKCGWCGWCGWSYFVHRPGQIFVFLVCVRRNVHSLVSGSCCCCWGGGIEAEGISRVDITMGMCLLLSWYFTSGLSLLQSLVFHARNYQLYLWGGGGFFSTFVPLAFFFTII